ncbi:MAG: hypothetical protein OXG72_17165 [Acidobacteria bacterium]|nr:hypothetical protein [Acidobacteriota bacterium]
MRFAIDRPVVFFSCPLSTEQEALRLFARELARTLDDPLLIRTRFSGWREAIDYAVEKCDRERVPLVLDELPYLQRSVPGVDSLLQHAWDAHDGAIKLFLTGSSFSVMDAAVADFGTSIRIARCLKRAEAERCSMRSYSATSTPSGARRTRRSAASI